ncbi:MAG: hypothetical protein GXO86_10875 [Chlorobi bacterium]|nr:hypothetical protein [Chlorobiota bacterium]
MERIFRHRINPVAWVSCIAFGKHPFPGGKYEPQANDFSRGQTENVFCRLSRKSSSQVCV